MIEVTNVIKSYGPVEALRGVSFQIAEGEIVGLLGPNGAGKTTIIKILTGYLQPDEGSVHIGGLDVLSDTRQVQAQLGYLPENAPLYPELSVQGYLKMIADLRQVPEAEQPACLSEAIYAAGLTEHLTRPISQLSKGFRQRVGLADALVADPRVLILDEPTIGLDPAQIQEVRHLIRSLGDRHTVLLSSHILPEVEKTCSHLVIIADGTIRAAGSIEQLRAGSAEQPRVVLEVRPGKAADGPAEMARAVGQAAGVAKVDREDVGDGWTRLLVAPSGGADVREALAALVSQRGWALREMRLQAPSIEELYVRFTAGEPANPGKNAA